MCYLALKNQCKVVTICHTVKEKNRTYKTIASMKIKKKLEQTNWKHYFHIIIFVISKLVQHNCIKMQLRLGKRIFKHQENYIKYCLFISSVSDNRPLKHQFHFWHSPSKRSTMTPKLGSFPSEV